MYMYVCVCVVIDRFDNAEAFTPSLSLSLSLSLSFTTRTYNEYEYERGRGNEDVPCMCRGQSQLTCDTCECLLSACAYRCGKTTSIMCLCRTLLGASRAKDAVLELNASDDRGIDVVRNKIKMFAQKKVSLPPGRHKVVILDEADSMTSGAQQALRRTMEVFSSTTRFALACNMSSKIIEPIQSRCAIIRFTRLGEKEVMARLVDVAEREHVATLPDGMEALVFTADGDMRQGLNNLQATAAGFGTVNAENVYRVCDQPHPMVLAGMISKCAEGRIEDAYAPLAKQSCSANVLDISGLFCIVA